MGSVKYRAVFADIDGTLLLPSTEGTFDPPVTLKEAVRDLKGRGIYFSVATARNYSHCSKLIEGLGLSTLQILNNGATIFDAASKKPLHEYFLGVREAETAIKALSNYEGLRVIVLDDGQRIEGIENILKWKLSKIVVLGTDKVTADRIFSDMKNIPDLSVTISVSGTGKGGFSVHITDSKATKGNALIRISEITGIKLPEIVGIGDSQNDMSFLRLCGLKLVMGNGSEDLKKIADDILPTVWENGALYGFKKYFFSQK